jgi:hypothetical protein
VRDVVSDEMLVAFVVPCWLLRPGILMIALAALVGGNVVQQMEMMDGSRGNRL